MKPQKSILRNISSKSWEHSADKASLSALNAIPGVDLLLKKFIGATTEKSMRLATLASAVRTSEKQFPRLYSLHKEACTILDMPYVPELFVSKNPFMNAGAAGVENPFIVLNSSVMDQLTDEEILAILGHELGHCMSGHVLYKTLLFFLIRFSTGMFNIPLSGIAIVPIILALKEWDRKSELSADRAGLLVVQDPMVCFSLLMKMSGGSDYSEMDINEFFLQAAEYENMESLSDSAHKILNIMMLEHPFPVLRLTELKSWVDCGAYEKIVGKTYIERGASESHFENIKEAGQQYKEDIKATKGPIAGVASSIFDAVDSISDQASEMKDKASGVWDSIFADDESLTR